MAGYYFEHEDYQAETNNNSEYNDDLDYYPRTGYYCLLYTSDAADE